ncbi:MAG: NUDIX hydrolase [Candidatus Eisenbacteria bacterium]|nr:NUDIX hydrolase [Candidatus Eisenbacteria bacterium]
MDSDWKVIETARVGDHGIFTVRRDRAVSPHTGYQKDYSILECSDWVNVVARTPEGLFVLVRQWRVGARRYTVEIPGGAVDRSDGGPEAAARRELREETGYTAERFLLLGTVEPNPAFQTNRCYTFLAENTLQTDELRLDPGEEIDVLLAGADEIDGMVERGEIGHALVIAGWFWYRRWLHRAREGGEEKPR